MSPKNPLGTTDEVFNYFSDNIQIMRREFNKNNDCSWDLTKVVSANDLLNDDLDEKLGFFVTFDVGYIAYSYDMSIYRTDSNTVLTKYYENYCLNGKDLYGVDNDGSLEAIYLESEELDKSAGNTLNDSFIPIDKVTTFNEFSLSYCLNPIKILKDNYDNSVIGDMTPICIEQRNNGCVPAAFTNVIFTYKESGSGDLTNGFTYSEVDYMFGNMAGYTEENGVYDNKILPGINSYMSFTGNNKNRDVLSQGSDKYSYFHVFRRDGSGHAVMDIGAGKSKHWWIFNTYWRMFLAGEQISNIKMSRLFLIKDLAHVYML